MGLVLALQSLFIHAQAVLTADSIDTANEVEVIEEIKVIGVTDENETDFHTLKYLRFLSPDATTVINLESMSDEVKNSPADVLNKTPGVFASSLSSGNDTHISIRGSGVSGIGGGRGVKIYQDGILLNISGGSVPFGFVDLQSAKSFELQRGNQANVLGAGVSGGVINLRSRTGKDLQGGSVRVEYGEHEHARLFVEGGFNDGAYDYYGSVSGFETDGQREHEGQEQQQLNLSFGADATDNLFTRTQLVYMNQDKEEAGTLNKRNWQEDPYDTNVESINVDTRRITEGLRLSQKFDVSFGPESLLEIPISHSYTPSFPVYLLLKRVLLKMS